jgi:hypothetical protein
VIGWSNSESLMSYSFLQLCHNACSRIVTLDPDGGQSKYTLTECYKRVRVILNEVVFISVD